MAIKALRRGGGHRASMSMAIKILATLSVLVALAAGSLALAYHRDLAAARAGLEGASRTVDSPWGPIEYADVGTGPPVLVIHGSGGGFDQGLALGAPLVSQGYRVIAPSRFGYLRSAMPAGASPQMQADALAWLTDILGVGPVAVVGFSAGALPAMQLALRHPEACRRLALGVPASYAPGRAPGESAALNGAARAATNAVLGSDFLFWAVERFAPGFATEMILATDPALVRDAPPDDRRRVAAMLRGVLPITERNWGILFDSAFAGRPEPYPVEEITCPMLVISARDDLYGTAKAAAYIADKAPSARLILYPTGGHMLVGHNAEAWEAIADFAREPTAIRPPQPSASAPRP